MKKKIYFIVLMCFFNLFILPAREIASTKNPNLSYNDIVWNFYQLHCGYETDTFHYAKFDWQVKTDENSQNFYWTIYEEENNNGLRKKNLTLWIDNGYIRITYYNKSTKFTDGTMTWNLANYADYIDFHNTFAKTLVEFSSRSQLEKKKHGKNYTQEKINQLTYLMQLFARI